MKRKYTNDILGTPLGVEAETCLESTDKILYETEYIVGIRQTF